MTENIEVISHKLETVHADVRQIESSVKDLTDAIVRLALIEERQTQTAMALERAFGLLDKLETRIAALEQLAPSNRRIHIWIDRATWVVMGLMGMALMRQIGLGS